MVSFTVSLKVMSRMGAHIMKRLQSGMKCKEEIQS